MKPGRGIQPVTLLKIRDGHPQRRRDRVIHEEPLEIRLAFQRQGVTIEKDIALTMRTPGADMELAAGFLLAEGIAKSPSDLPQMTYCVGENRDQQQYNLLKVQLREGLEFDPEQLLRHFASHASCGICGRATIDALLEMGQEPLPTTHPSLPTPQTLQSLPTKLRETQAWFEKTGGVHGAALFSMKDGTMLSWQEDIGRHNAVDKVIGEAFLAGQLPLHNAILLVSGRVSFEIMQKALQAGIPMVAAIGAPSSLAIEVAQTFSMTLLGFLKEDGFNVYAGTERIDLREGNEE